MHEQGVLFTLGDDSHGPNDVGMHYDKLISYIDSIGIQTVYSLQRSSMLVTGKEMIGTGKEMIVTGNEMIGTGKEMIGTGKESIGRRAISVASLVALQPHYK